MSAETNVFSARIQAFSGKCHKCGHDEMLYVGVCEEENCRNTELADSQEAITELTARHSATHLPGDREIVGFQSWTQEIDRRSN